jgi:hypothetical protein
MKYQPFIIEIHKGCDKANQLLKELSNVDKVMQIMQEWAKQANKDNKPSFKNGEEEGDIYEGSKN